METVQMSTQKKMAMAKHHSAPTLAFGQFGNQENFLRWVATHHGKRIREDCQKRLEELAQSRPHEEIDPIEVLDEVIGPVQHLDTALSTFRARFVC
jgi:hypothetical protein